MVSCFFYTKKGEGSPGPSPKSSDIVGFYFSAYIFQIKYHQFTALSSKLNRHTIIYVFTYITYQKKKSADISTQYFCRCQRKQKIGTQWALVSAAISIVLKIVFLLTADEEITVKGTV